MDINPKEHKQRDELNKLNELIKSLENIYIEIIRRNKCVDSYTKMSYVDFMEKNKCSQTDAILVSDNLLETELHLKVETIIELIIQKIIDLKYELFKLVSNDFIKDYINEVILIRIENKIKKTKPKEQLKSSSLRSYYLNEDDEYNFVNIDDDSNREILSDVENKFMFYMNLSLISRNMISRVKTLFKLSHVLTTLNITDSFEESKIIELYLSDNIIPIQSLKTIIELKYNDKNTELQIDDDNYINNQQLKYILGILMISKIFIEYMEELTSKNAGDREELSSKNAGDKRPIEYIYESLSPDLYIKEFINSIISRAGSNDLYDLNDNKFHNKSIYKETYEISLYQFNMLISNDKEYIKNMFYILFIQFIGKDEIIKIEKIEKIVAFALYLFKTPSFHTLLNYMHGKKPNEEYTKLNATTSNRIRLGLELMTQVDDNRTFNNFKTELLKFLNNHDKYRNDNVDHNKIGDVKHTIDTIMKIYYDAYLLGKKPPKPPKSPKSPKPSKLSKLSKSTKGGKYYNYKNTGIKKIFNKKERCIYKMQGSNKEYIRHKNELISFKDFKTINNKPVKTDKKPVKTDKKSVKTDNKPVKTDKKHVKTDNKPVKTDKKSVKTDKKPVKTDKKPVKTDNKSVKTDKKSVKTDKKTVKTDKKTVKTDKKTVKTDKKTVKKPVKKNIFFNLF